MLHHCNQIPIVTSSVVDPDPKVDPDSGTLWIRIHRDVKTINKRQKVYCKVEDKNSPLGDPSG